MIIRQKTRLLVAIAALLGLLTVIWFINKDSWFPLEKSIAAAVVPSHSECTEADFPLRVVLENQSGREVTWVHWEVYVRRAGYSNILETGDGVSDKIMRPGDTASYCMAQPGRAMSDLLARQGADLQNPYAEFPNELEYSIKVLVAHSE